jgi:hypothetical protein
MLLERGDPADNTLVIEKRCAPFDVFFDIRDRLVNHVPDVV